MKLARRFPTPERCQNGVENEGFRKRWHKR
jgi:hypothetical protein